jgi:hypothetical protein
MGNLFVYKFYILFYIYLFDSSQIYYNLIINEYGGQLFIDYDTSLFIIIKKESLTFFCLLLLKKNH